MTAPGATQPEQVRQMVEAIQSALSGVGYQAVLSVLILIGLVLIFIFLYSQNRKGRKAKPGLYLEYTVSDKTVSECRSLLKKNTIEDIFSFQLEEGRLGEVYIHFVLHNATEQPLDTLFHIRYGDEPGPPAKFALSFAREAFGMREPVLSEPLLDEFFAQKLGAVRVVAQTDGVS